MNINIRNILSFAAAILVSLFVVLLNFYSDFGKNNEMYFFEIISSITLSLLIILYVLRNRIKVFKDTLLNAKEKFEEKYLPNKNYIIFIIFSCFIVFAAKQLIFINKYAVNMMFWDQWDFYNPLFNHESLWKAFTHQHGPHRQGIGFLLTEILAKASGWNSRWDAFGISFCLILSSFIAIIIGVKKCYKNSYYLTLIPLAFFTPHGWEMLVGPSNISHGAMPVLLIMFYCLTLLHKNPKLKWVLLLVINFFSVFTGFGLFLGLITPGLAIREVIHAFKLRDKSYAFIYVISFSISILTWVLFFVDYKFADTAPSGPTTLLGIFKFMALLLVHFYGASQSTYISLILGYGLLLLFLYITALHGYKLIKKDIMYSDLSLIIFCLCAYNLLYCFGTAYGRAGSTDLNAWSAPRYITLLIPGVLALILHVVGYLRSVLWSNVLCLTLCIGMFHFATYEQGGVEYFSRGRKAWRDAYLKTGDSFKANEISNFRVYPVDVLENKLRYLKDKKLNLFTSKSK